MAKKRKSFLRVDKVTYGHMPKEEAFRKALEPYFTGPNFGKKISKPKGE